jgi:CHASE2 domain-containing sensor protein
MFLNIFDPILQNITSWQDLVIAVIGLLFGFILIPQLYDVIKKNIVLNLYTAALTTIGLYIMTATFFTMGFWITFIADFFTATVWLLLFIFSYLNFRKIRDKKN